MSLKTGDGATKILTIGPPCGQIRLLTTKVKAINDKHGPFQALLCLGDLFTPYDGDDAELSEEESQLLQGEIKIPIPTYFFLSASPLHPIIQAIVTKRSLVESAEPLEIASNIFFLGKAGVFKLSNGLRVAVVGGLWDASRYNSSSEDQNEVFVESVQDPFLTKTSLKKLLDHPSFHQSQTIQANRTESEEPPQSLAAARAQMAAKAEAVERLARDQEANMIKPPVDILLTTTWPTGITMFANAEKLPHSTSRMWGAPPIAQLVRACQPRYHFSLAPGSCGRANDDNKIPLGIAGLEGTAEGSELREMGVFWEREPYRNDKPPASHPFCSTTRFINLARLANAKKHRWFMALNLIPADHVGKEEAKAAAGKASVGATPSPFSDGGYGGSAVTKGHSKREADAAGVVDEFEAGPNFRWSGNGKRAKKGGANGLPSRPDGPLPNGPKERKPLAIPVGPQDCWFCLSNSQCAKHLIVAIGTECYVAMPKGQLPPTSDPMSPVPGGGHVLIIPIEHFPSLLGHSDAELARPIADEMNSWRSAIRKMYASFDARMVSWEVCKTIGTRAGHMQSQAVPVLSSLFDGIEDYFREAAQKWSYTFIEDQEEVKSILQISNDTSIRQEGCDYVRIDFDDKIWVMLLGDRPFYLQFPRETLASYMNIADRSDWKKCARSEAIETAEAKALKAAFAGFSKEVA